MAIADGGGDLEFVIDAKATQEMLVRVVRGEPLPKENDAWWAWVRDIVDTKQLGVRARWVKAHGV